VSVRAIVLALVALALAGATVFLARGWLDAERAAIAARAPVEEAERPAIRVLVAKTDLVVGQFLKPEHLRWQAWPDETVAPSYAIEGERRLEEFVGAVVRKGIATGEPVTDRRVVKPGERGFLAAVLEPGMRAVSVPVNATTGIAGFVFPGDRVDVILTHGIKTEDADGKSIVRRASETVLSNVRVLAVDQRTDDDSTEAAVAKTATLEVTAKQAEIVSVVGELGKLSLALRSLARETPAPPVEGTRPGKRSVKLASRSTYTWDSEVSRLLDPPTTASTTRTVDVVRGDKAEKVELE